MIQKTAVNALLNTQQSSLRLNFNTMILMRAQFADGKLCFFFPFCLDETEGLWYNGMELESILVVSHIVN